MVLQAARVLQQLAEAGDRLSLAFRSRWKSRHRDFSFGFTRFVREVLVDMRAPAGPVSAAKRIFKMTIVGDHQTGLVGRRRR